MKYIGTGHTISPPFPLITYKMWMFMKVNGAQLTLLSFGTSLMVSLYPSYYSLFFVIWCLIYTYWLSWPRFVMHMVSIKEKMFLFPPFHEVLSSKSMICILSLSYYILATLYSVSFDVWYVLTHSVDLDLWCVWSIKEKMFLFPPFYEVLSSKSMICILSLSYYFFFVSIYVKSFSWI